jgi:hypothetical protein
MFYYTVDPRTIAIRKGFGRTIRTPDDMKGMKMRIPPSKLLGKFYQLAGANPTVVAWGETPTALKQGVADGLDPAIGALYTFGFIDILESITTVFSVPDAQMFAANEAWYAARLHIQSRSSRRPNDAGDFPTIGGAPGPSTRCRRRGKFVRLRRRAQRWADGARAARSGTRTEGARRCCIFESSRRPQYQGPLHCRDYRVESRTGGGGRCPPPRASVIPPGCRMRSRGLRSRAPLAQNPCARRQHRRWLMLVATS